jgi:nucleotidyltransferase/DNA polymerase involved in DNA repair
LTKLKKNKIKTTDDFLIINKTSKQRAINSKKYSINIQELTTLLSIFDLIRIKGVGPTAAKLLIKADIKSIRDFQNMDIKKVEEKLIKMNEKFKISPFTPNKENLDVWKNLSQKLKIIIL